MLSSTCDLVLGGMRTDILQVKVSSDIASDSAYKLTVTVTGSNLRKSQATVTLTVVPVHTALVTVTAQTKGARFNPSDKVKLNGKISYYVRGNLSWSIDDSELVMSDVALTRTSYELIPTPGRVSLNTLSVDLVIAANVLRERGTFVFRLSCRSVDGSASQSTIVVTTNGPPLVGQFEIKPSSGTALTTKFVFLARNWLDEDLPLSYQYGFVSKSGYLMVLQSKSEISYGTVTLPAGDAQNDYMLPCVAQVFDNMNANSSATVSIGVSEAKLSAQDLQV